MIRRFLAALAALLLTSAPLAHAADVKPVINAAGQLRPVHAGETVGVANGGTGAATFTAHCVLVGETTSAFHIACPSSAGQVLTDNGAGSDPTFQAAAGGAPGGSNGQIQYNNAGAFGGFALGGDCTFSVPSLTCNKTGGVSFGYFATGTDAANLTGTVSVNRFNSGTGASSSTFLRGDGTWAVAGAGTVTTTGTPASGNLAKFSGATVVTNGDLSGDVTTSGALATTLATVNSNVGTFGDATHVGQFTVNAKGLITGASSVGITGGVGGLTMTLLAIATPSGTGVVTFSSISGAYTHLRIVATGRSTGAGSTQTSLALQFNSDTGAHYSRERVFGNGSGVGADSAAGATSINASEIPLSGATANYPASFIIDIPYYAGTTFYKTLLGHYGNWLSGAPVTNSISGFWADTSAITRIDMTLASGNWVSGSSFSLYGIN